MKLLNEIEEKILYELYDISFYRPSDFEFDIDNYKLIEADEILRVRELVFYLENMISLGFLDTEGPFYKSSDKVSFKYMNDAVEVYFDKIYITDLGCDYIREKGMSKQEKVMIWLKDMFKNFISKPRNVLLGFLVSMMVGILIGLLI